MWLKRGRYGVTIRILWNSVAEGRWGRRLLLSAAALIGAARGLNAEPQVAGVEASRPFFNPTLGQRIDIGFQVTDEGLVTVGVLDRDGEPVRLLASKRRVSPGRTLLRWDGRDDEGLVVPDEAYSVAIEFRRSGGAKLARYPGTNRAAKEIKVDSANYDPASGVISYKLPMPGRIDIEAKYLSSSPYSASKVAVITGAPRAAGLVIDIWSGFDRSGKLYLVDQPGFSLSVTATTLPLPALITVGNRSADFESYRRKRGAAASTVLGVGATTLAGGR
jgi:hypothetical protein